MVRCVCRERSLSTPLVISLPRGRRPKSGPSANDPKPDVHVGSFAHQAANCRLAEAIDASSSADMGLPIR